jgi:hypothetical protein
VRNQKNKVLEYLYFLLGLGSHFSNQLISQKTGSRLTHICIHETRDLGLVTEFTKFTENLSNIWIVNIRCCSKYLISCWNVGIRAH